MPTVIGRHLPLHPNRRPSLEALAQPDDRFSPPFQPPMDVIDLADSFRRGFVSNRLTEISPLQSPHVDDDSPIAARGRGKREKFGCSFIARSIGSRSRLIIPPSRSSLFARFREIRDATPVSPPVILFIFAKIMLNNFAINTRRDRVGVK